MLEVPGCRNPVQGGCQTLLSARAEKVASPVTALQCITACSYPRQTGADLGFVCPIHLKGSPEGAKPPTCALTAGLYGGDVGLSPENLKI